MAGLVRPTLCLAKQLFPFGARQALVVPIGAGMLAAVIEKALIVVLRLQRLDLRLDESIKLGEIRHQFGGQIEVHAQSPSSVF